MLQQLPYYAIGFKRAHAIDILVQTLEWSHAELSKFSNDEIANHLFAASIISPSQCAGVFTEIPPHVIEAQVLAGITDGLYSLSRYYQISHGLSEFELQHSFHYYDFDRNK